MSIQASLDAHFKENLDFEVVLQNIEKDRYFFCQNHQIEFFDDEEFNWKRLPKSSLPEVLDRLRSRFDNDLICGLIFYDANGIGVLLHFMPNKRYLMLLLSVNRRKLLGSDKTDFAYYLSSLNHLLEGATLEFEEI